MDDELAWLPLKAARVLAGGKREYAAQDKDRLARYCLSSGSAVTDLARQAGVNANLLRKWIRQVQALGAGDRAPPFVTVTMPPEASSVPCTLPALLRDMIAALGSQA